MSADQSKTQKSGKPEGLENKALDPSGAENKTAQPAPPAASEADDKVTLVVAHPIPAGRIGNEKDLNPGDETQVTKYMARSLVQQGVARAKS